MGVACVAPYTGAWIEIMYNPAKSPCGQVAPYTGAWIEIVRQKAHRGGFKVAPYTGAWIEIDTLEALGGELDGRSLHGSVD